MSAVIPVVVAVSVTHCRGLRYVRVTCPFCGRAHEHGWGFEGDEQPGTRLSHCAPYRSRGGRLVVPHGGSYFITVPDELRGAS